MSTTTHVSRGSKAGKGRPTPGNEPPLGPLAALAAILFVAAVVAGALTGGAMPSPLADAADIHAYLTDHHTSILVTSLGTLAAVVPFTIFVGVLADRLKLLGIVRGGSSLAQTAGSATAGIIAISALTMWVLAQPAVAGADTALQQVLLAVAFATGGPGFAIFLALTITALVGPARRTGILRNPAIVTGYLLIVVAVVGCIGLAWSPAFAVLPLARFGGLAWLTYAGFALPASRARVRIASAD